MEQANPAAKFGVILAWGVCWGGLTALGTAFLDWHLTHRVDSVHLVAWIVIFMSIGTFWGLVIAGIRR